MSMGVDRDGGAGTSAFLPAGELAKALFGDPGDALVGLPTKTGPEIFASAGGFADTAGEAIATDGSTSD